MLTELYLGKFAAMGLTSPQKVKVRVKEGHTAEGSRPLGGTPHPSSLMATIHDDDERLLARIGYKQVWRKKKCMPQEGNARKDKKLRLERGKRNCAENFPNGQRSPMRSQS